jgi:hypothetical protein
MEVNEGKPKFERKNVRTDTNADTGVPYFEKRKVKISDPSQPPEEPPKPVVPAQSDLGGGKFDPDKDTEGWDYTNH